jgi:cytidylate kinase
VSRGVADQLGLSYLDTGAMYRAFTWWVLRAGIDPQDASAVAAIAESPVFTPVTNPLTPALSVDGVDVTDVVRSAEVTAQVSFVARVPEIRARLVSEQQLVVTRAIDAERGIVVEGRDIGTVVLPNADVKVYLTADPTKRAYRRALEEAVKAGVDQPEIAAQAAADEVAESLAARDAIDSTRTASPLTQADDAELVDASDMNLQETIEHVVALVLKAQAS